MGRYTGISSGSGCIDHSDSFSLTDCEHQLHVRESYASTPDARQSQAFPEAGSNVTGAFCTRRNSPTETLSSAGTSLRRVLSSYFDYYHRSRTHLSLSKHSPKPRSIQPPDMGSVVAVSQGGGMHHRYERRTA